MSGVYSFLPLGLGPTRGLLPKFIGPEPPWPVSVTASTLPFSPHAFTIETASEPVDVNDLSVLPPVYRPPVALTGQITPKRAEAAFAATGLEMRRPHKLLCGLGVEHLFIVGSRVTYNGRRFKVAAPPLVQDATGLVDHLSIYLDELQFGAEPTVVNATPEEVSFLPLGLGLAYGLLPKFLVPDSE